MEFASGHLSFCIVYENNCATARELDSASLATDRAAGGAFPATAARMNVSGHSRGTARVAAIRAVQQM